LGKAIDREAPLRQGQRYCAIGSWKRAGTAWKGRAV